MTTALIVGGAGAVGRNTVKTLAADATFDRVVIGDIAMDAAQALAAELGPTVEARLVDATSPATLLAAMQGCGVVVNCSGPFYRFARPVLQAAIDSRVQYVDVCDDVDATRDLLSMHSACRDAGVTALIGMGSSPGITNLLARLTADMLLDEVVSIDLYHAHGGEGFEGAGVIAHRFHGMSMDVPMYLDGRLQTVGFFAPEGVALRQRVSFHLLGDGITVYPYPHPEQLTLPEHIPCRRVTNCGTVLPDSYFQLTVELARLGLSAHEPVEVAGRPVVPLDFSIAWLLQQRERILREEAFGAQRGCVKVVVAGTRRGKNRSYIFSMASTNQALGEGTGIPAAIGAILMARGKVAGPGVLPPEAAVKPLEFLAEVAPIMKATQRGGGFEGLLVQKQDENGALERVGLPF